MERVHKITDEELVKGCLKQDMAMQKALYFKIGPALMAVCARYLKPMETAEEVFHDVILKIYDKINKYSGTGSLAAWCRRLAVNTCLDYLRKNKHQVRINYLEEQTIEPIDIADDVSLLDDSNLEMLEGLIETLPQQQKMVLNLFIIDDFSHKEIAEKLNISEGASRSLLQRAKQKLKDELKVKEHINGQQDQF